MVGPGEVDAEAEELYSPQPREQVAARAIPRDPKPRTRNKRTTGGTACWAIVEFTMATFTRQLNHSSPHSQPYLQVGELTPDEGRKRRKQRRYVPQWSLSRAGMPLRPAFVDARSSLQLVTPVPVFQQCSDGRSSLLTAASSCSTLIWDGCLVGFPLARRAGPEQERWTRYSRVRR